MPRRVEPKVLEKLPSLTANDFAGDVAVFTVKEAQDNIRVQKPDGRVRYSTRIVFEELPGFNFWPNATSVGHLRAAIGANADRWTGKKVVVEKIDTDTPEGVPVVVVWVAEPRTWRGHLEAFKAANG